MTISDADVDRELADAGRILNSDIQEDQQNALNNINSGKVPTKNQEKVSVRLKNIGELGELGDSLIDKSKKIVKNSEKTMGELGECSNSPNSPTSSNSPNSPNLSFNDKILLFCIKPRKQTDIASELKVDVKRISQAIYRKDRNTGLIVEGLLEQKYINDVVHYVITEAGSNHLEIIADIQRREDEDRYRKIVECNTVIQKINWWADYIRANNDLEANVLTITEHDYYIEFDFNDIVSTDVLIGSDLLENPLEHFDCIKQAIAQFIDPEDAQKVTAGITNLPHSQSLQIGNIRKAHVGKLYCIEGIVKQITAVRPRVSCATYECPSCGEVIQIIQNTKNLEEPNGCRKCGRRGKFRSLTLATRDFQAMRVEESGHTIEGRSQPQDTTVLFYDHLTSTSMQRYYNPGNGVRIVGVIKDEAKLNNKGGKSTERVIYVEAVHIAPQAEIKDYKITPEDEKAIIELSRQNNIMERLQAAVAPDVTGYDDIKKALLCQIVGGCLKRRSEIHILLVGDPGMAKTKMARSILDLRANSRYISGTSASNVGISASVVRDEFTGDWSIVAGALPLANQSIAILDELDKMKEKDSLHDALEQQQITISKAGINASMECKTAVLATANPIRGRFDLNEPLDKQIGLSPPLLSRFDIIYPFLDSGTQNKKVIQFLLKQETGQVVETCAIDRDMLRKYLTYAKRMVPKISADIDEPIQKYWDSLRSDAGSMQHMNVRQFEGMLRMVSAIAKIRLHQTVTMDDVREGCGLVISCYKRLLKDGDFDTLITGVTSEKRAKIDAILKAIPHDHNIPTAKLHEDLKIEYDELDKLLDDMRQKGHVYEPVRNQWRRV